METFNQQRSGGRGEEDSAYYTTRMLEALGKSISSPVVPSCILCRQVAAAFLSPVAAAKGLRGHQPCETALGKGKSLPVLSALPQLSKGPLSQSPASVFVSM